MAKEPTLLTTAQQKRHEAEIEARRLFIVQWRLDVQAALDYMERMIRTVAGGRPERGMILMDDRPEYRTFRQSIRACSRHRRELKKLLRSVK